MDEHIEHEVSLLYYLSYSSYTKKAANCTWETRNVYKMVVRKPHGSRPHRDDR